MRRHSAPFDHATSLDNCASILARKFAYSARTPSPEGPLAKEAQHYAENTKENKGYVIEVLKMGEELNRYCERSLGTHL